MLNQLTYINMHHKDHVRQNNIHNDYHLVINVTIQLMMTLIIIVWTKG